MLVYLAAVTLIICLAVAVQLTLGLRRVACLEDWPPDAAQWPRVSIIVPARNERQHVEPALRSLLRLDYPDLEIVAVDDRSTDGTGEILDRLAGEFPELCVVHVTDLPAGWLGKNHALGMGAARATGHWLLFTDADVSMEPLTLRRAVSFAEQHGLDHLALTPGIDMPSRLLESFVLTFVTFFCIYFQPWKARDPRSKRYIGVGAFNLLRRHVYREIGTHEAIRMRPDDDVMLGKLLKRHGYRQDSACGIGLISVPWYGSLREVFVGLEKNAFSGVNYSVSTVVAGAVAILLLNVWPFVALLVTRGPTQWLYAATALALLAMWWRVAGWLRLPRSTVLWVPLCVILFLVIQWRAMFLTLKNGGIRWRDTFYPLDELKANRV